MNKYIVTTTINKPTVALKRFMKLLDWKMIVVGDLKTPHKYYKNKKNILYLSPLDQEKISLKLSNLIGWNCIQRRNFGYLLAYNLGADIVATIDDDNIPYKNWGRIISLNREVLVDYYLSKNIAFDPLSIFKTKDKIWHRGFPLQLLNLQPFYQKKKKYIKVSVQANLWNNNPDIDAINRMVLKKENFNFSKCNKFSSNQFLPFNSQNTLLGRNVLKNYFLFPHIGRMDDIWASYYVQALGHKVLFDKATVYQKRNYHNNYDDFKKELIGYKNNLNLILSLKNNPQNIKFFLPKKSYQALQLYEKLFI